MSSLLHCFTQFYSVLHCVPVTSWRRHIIEKFLYPPPRLTSARGGRRVNSNHMVLVSSSEQFHTLSILQFIALLAMWCIEFTLFLYPFLNSVTQYIALLELPHSDSKSHASSASCRHLSSQRGAWDIICSELQYVKRLPAICQGS